MIHHSGHLPSLCLRNLSRKRNHLLVPKRPVPRFLAALHTLFTGDAVVAIPVPGFTYELINTPGYGDTAILAQGIVPGTPAVVVKFVPDINGAGVLYLVQPDVIASRP